MKMNARRISTGLFLVTMLAIHQPTQASASHPEEVGGVIENLIAKIQDWVQTRIDEVAGERQPTGLDGNGTRAETSGEAGR